MKRSRSRLIAAIGLIWLSAAPLLNAQESAGKKVIDRVETGSVRWQRDLERSKAESKATGKPVFLLFQEIPGCQTCQDFGKGPLSHPLLVEAIETEFVPVLVYNNRQGRDAVLLKQYDEPSWNNPVVRYVDSAGEDLIKRKDRIWTVAGTAQRMIQSLESANRQVPEYLRSLVDSLGPTETATFAMHCFWEGEAKLGGIDGVVSTRSGWLSGLEVVTVKYQPQRVDYSQLVKVAQQFECANKVFAHSKDQLKAAARLVGKQAVPFPKGQQARDAKVSDQKYYLAATRLARLPLTEFQATKLNALVKLGNAENSLGKLLSPRQQRQLQNLKAASASSSGG